MQLNFRPMEPMQFQFRLPSDGDANPFPPAGTLIVNSRFLERPQKQSRRNQLIHRRLTKTKSTGSGQNPESQAGGQSDGYGGWCLELRRGGRYEEDDKSG